MAENYFSPITTYDTEIPSSIHHASLLFHFFSQTSYTFIFYGAILPFYNLFIYASLASGASSSFFFPPCIKLFTTVALETRIQTESCFYWGEHPIARRRRWAVFFRPNSFESTVDSVLLKRLFRYLRPSDAPLARSCYNDGLKIYNLEL